MTASTCLPATRAPYVRQGRPVVPFSEGEDRAMALMHVHGWSLREIADRLGRCRSSVQMRLTTLAEREERRAAARVGIILGGREIEGCRV